MKGNYKKWLDRINAKQDILTEDNLGQLMDSELSTKSTPTSGDTVLGRDSLTGKAVEIPTDQLGGNVGTVDLTTKLDKGGYVGTAQDLKNSIDNLQIGNVNLWRNSKLFGLYTNNVGLGTSVLMTDEADHYFRATPDAGNAVSLFGWYTFLENNTEYIHGLWVRNNGNTAVNVMTYNSAGLPTGEVSRMLQPNVWTFIKSELIKGTGQASYFILICDTANVTIDYKKAILVKGNKLGNDWEPNPEDKQDRLQDTTGNIGVGKTDASATEKLDVNGNVKSNSYKFNLQASITPTPNTLVPKTDGSGLIWYDNNSVLRNIGENLFSADLSSSTARNHSLNASFTIDTKGNAHSIKNLPNKNTDIANFRKVRVQNASGLDAVVDSKNLLTDGVTSMSDAEKDAYRIASLKTGENYSQGQPQPFAIFPPIVENSNEIQEVVVVGSNLFLNNQSLGSALVSLVSETTSIEYPLNVEVNQTNPSVLSFGYNFSTLPLGNYWIKVIHNGLINTNRVYLQVLDTIIPQTLPNLSWNGYMAKTNTYFSDSNNTTDFVSFTSTAINFTRKYNALGGSTPYLNEGNVFINSSAFNLPNDFYLEFSGTCPWQVLNNIGARQPTISMGLSAYNSVFDISNTFIAGFGLASGFQNSVLLSDTSITLNIGDVTNFVFYVIKRGSKIVLGLKSKSGILYSTYTAPTGNQFMIKLAHFNPFTTAPNTLISFALTKILSL